MFAFVKRKNEFGALPVTTKEFALELNVSARLSAEISGGVGVRPIGSAFTLLLAAAANTRPRTRASITG